MAGEMNSKKIVDFALQPVGPRPDRHERIEDCVVTGEPHFEPQFGAQRDGNQLIMHFKPWLEGMSIEAGSVGQ